MANSDPLQLALSGDVTKEYRAAWAKAAITVARWIATADAPAILEKATSLQRFQSAVGEALGFDKARSSVSIMSANTQIALVQGLPPALSDCEPVGPTGHKSVAASEGEACGPGTLIH